MKKYMIIASLLLAGYMYAQEQEANEATSQPSGIGHDTVLNRSITVEREFQPIIQSAGKIQQKPATLEAKIQPVEVQYSDFSTSLAPSFNLSPLLSQTMKFGEGQPLNGLIRGGIGHTHTLFDFLYHVDDKKRSILDIYANHHAIWGRKADSDTRVGISFRHPFSTCEIYFGLEGANNFYTRYGRYYNGSNGLTVKSIREMQAEDKQSVWKVNIKAGIRATKRQELQYDVNVGYHLLSLPTLGSEHQIRTKAHIEWTGSEHHGGINLGVINTLFSMDTAFLAKGTYNNKHAIRIEPFYAYYGDRVLVHAGVNLDVNIGKGQMMSKNENISFAPSPNVHFEAQIAKQWLTIYADAKGKLGEGSLSGYMRDNKYMHIDGGVTSKDVASYTPVDAELGFHIRPQKWLFMEVHAGYALEKNVRTYVNMTDSLTSTTPTPNNHYRYGSFEHILSDYSRIKIGAAFSFHYQDIINVHVWGDYYKWYCQGNQAAGFYASLAPAAGRIYDRPSWEAGIRIDGRIDEHWSLYSSNRFAGSRWAMVYRSGAASQEDIKLKPMIDIDLGCQYDLKEKNLSIFLQLNNIICRYNDIYYGYQSQGINGMAGVTWRF